MRAIRYLLGGAAGLLVLAVAATLLLAAHPGGLRWLAARADSVVPGELSIDEPRGSLLGEIAADRVRYQNAAVEIVIQQPRLSVRLLPLAAGELRVREFIANRVQIRLLDSGTAVDDTAELELPQVDVPVALRLLRSDVGTLELHSGAVHETLRDVDVALALRGSRLALRRLSFTRDELAAQLSGELRMRERWPLELTVAWQLPPAELSGTGTFAGNLDALQLAHTLQIPDLVYVTGDVSNPLRRLQVRLEARWTEVRLPVAEAYQPILLAGTAQLAGTPDDYTLELESGLRAISLGTAQLTTRLQGRAATLVLQALKLDALDGQIKATGQARLDAAAAELSLTASNLSLERLDPRLPRLRSMTASVTGWPEQPLTVTVTDSELQTAAATARLTGKLTATADQVVIDRAEARAGVNAARFAGAVWPQLRGDFAIEAPQLQQLDPRAAGRLQASGKVRGTPPALAGRLEVSADALRWDTLSAGALAGSVELGADTALELRLDVADLAWQDSGAHQLAVAGNGSLDALQLELTGAGPAGTAQLSATTGWSEEQLRVALATAQLAPTDAPAWTLAAPAMLRVLRPGSSTASVTVTAHCWSAAPAELCIDDSRYADDTLRLQASLRALPLATLQPLLAQLDSRYSWTGSAAANVALSGTPAAPQVALSWRQQDTVITWQESSADARQASFPQLELTVRGDRGGAEIRGTTASVAGADIQLSGTAGAFAAGATPVELQLNGLLPDIALLAPIVEASTPLQDPTGALTAELRLAGPLAEPALAGSVIFRDGRAALPLTGIELSDINIELQSSAPRAASVTGRLRSGDGQLNMAGEVAWRDGVSADLQLQGDAVQVLRFPEQLIWASPELRIAADAERIQVTGTVTVPQADVVVTALPASGTAASPDVVVVREAADGPERARRIELSADVQVVAGDDVRLRGFGLDTELAGALQLQTSGATPAPVVRGSLRSRNGQFAAYGRELAIERGVLVFTGDAENPDVNVRAVRTLRYEGQDVKIGVLLSGPLSNMETRLFGEPAMSESDALSFLVLNRPLERSAGADQEQLSGAAVALGVVNLLPATERVKDSLGLDEIEFAGMTRESSAIIAGKRISDDFYIRYSYGLFERVGRFILRYDMGRGLSLEAGSGQEQTIDLLYSIDR